MLSLVAGQSAGADVFTGSWLMGTEERRPREGPERRGVGRTLFCPEEKESELDAHPTQPRWFLNRTVIRMN